MSVVIYHFTPNCQKSLTHRGLRIGTIVPKCVRISMHKKFWSRLSQKKEDTQVVFQPIRMVYCKTCGHGHIKTDCGGGGDLMWWFRQKMWWFRQVSFFLLLTCRILSTPDSGIENFGRGRRRWCCGIERGQILVWKVTLIQWTSQMKYELWIWCCVHTINVIVRAHLIHKCTRWTRGGGGGGGWSQSHFTGHRVNPTIDTFWTRKDTSSCLVQWNLVIKRSDITKPSYNKVNLLAQLFINFFFLPRYNEKPDITR